MPKLAKISRQCASRFRASVRGATAVEFALIAPVFFGLLIAIFEVAIFLFAQANLQAAASASGRLFMTGQVQNGNMTQSQFTSQICPMIQVLFDCTKLMVNVQSYPDFGSASTTQPTLTYGSGGQVTNTWSYTPGTPGQIMVVQLVYQWPIVSGPFGFILPNNANGNTEMMGVTAFRVEPY